MSSITDSGNYSAYATGNTRVNSPRVTPQLGSWAPRGVYARPQNIGCKAGFLVKLLGLFGLVPGGAFAGAPPLEVEVLLPLLFFFVRTTPRETPTAMRTARVNAEPMTWCLVSGVHD